jgi:hypothetical protein
MAAIQFMYFCIYGAALYHSETAGRILESGFQIPATIGTPLVAILAMCGIAVRVYLSSALAFDHPDLPARFRTLFPALWFFDSIWAASPFLLVEQVRLGLILGCVALLAYVPFSQKTLMENLSSQNFRGG